MDEQETPLLPQIKVTCKPIIYSSNQMAVRLYARCQGRN